MKFKILFHANFVFYLLKSKENRSLLFFVTFYNYSHLLYVKASFLLNLAELKLIIRLKISGQTIT